MSEILQNAKSIEFLTPEKNNNIATILIHFEDWSTALALYAEVIRVNKLKEQIFKFKKASSSLILSFVIKATGVEHAKMLLDYDEKEFDDFISKVKEDSDYLVLFGLEKDGRGGFAGVPGDQKEFLTMYGYIY